MLRCDRRRAFRDQDATLPNLLRISRARIAKSDEKKTALLDLVP